MLAQMFKLISLIFTFAFLLFGLLLGVLNPNSVKLDVYLLSFDFPLGLALAIVMVIGMLVGALLIKMQVTQLKWRLKKQTRLNQKQADELVQTKKALAESKRSAQTVLNPDLNRQDVLENKLPN
ncbi:lipopolysaccharide assembly protein A [uncultured Thiomicrorhabdus sp.]